MRTSPAAMEKRLSDPSKSPHQNLSSSSSRKSKRRSSRKNNLSDATFDTWANNPQNDPDGGLASGVGCPPRMLWQSTGVSQNVPSNGQRLFAAMSDPSVCGYSPMPLAYTMQPVSLPAMCRMYQPMPMQNVRNVPSGRRHRCNEHLVNVCPNANNNVANGYRHLQENRGLESTVHITYQNGDYTSLPPTANKDNAMNGEELNSEHRRYSDPGLGPAENVPHLDSDDSDSVESGSSITTIGRSNKLVLSLVEQITELKKCNNQLFKELNEMKLNLEDIKVKTMQYKHNTTMDYQPGMLSELIREIREVNKNREEELAMKMKSLLEERNSQQDQLSKLMKEKEESDQRITRLEEEVMALKLGATNEGREIAAFEEETLALRRELQEARASRNLAENHATKCVNLAVSRSVTPVTFDMPSITSTPVRTALAQTRSLPLVLPSASPSHTSFVSSSSSALRSRSAEVAALLVSETKSDRKSESCEGSPRSAKDESDRSETISCQTAAISTNDHAVDTAETVFKMTVEDQNSRLDTANNFREVYIKELANRLMSSDRRNTCDTNTARNDGEDHSSTTKEKTQTIAAAAAAAAATVAEKHAAGDQLRENCAQVETELFTEKVEEKISVSSSTSDTVIDERKDTWNERSSKKTSKIERSVDHASWQRLCNFQRGSLGKKSRRKKCELKRWLSETDKSSKSHQNSLKVPTGTTSSNSSETSGDTGVNESCPNGDHTSRAITDVPEVAVVDGGSIMPKDLCSTGPLTSRTKTAPSRATYTTAYI